MAGQSSAPLRRPTVSQTFNKVFTRNASWLDKDELLDVVYWGRQVLALIVGLLYGLWPMTSFWGLASYVALTVFVFNHYVVNVQEQDPDEMTFMDVAKEGFGSALATFLVMWITVDFEDFYIPTVDLGIKNTEKGHCGKTFGILKHALEHNEFNDVSWFVIADDDSLISVSRLYRVLNCLPKTKKLILGERYGYGFSLDGLGGYDYPTGGAGMIFSRPAVRQIVAMCSCPSNDSPDDMIIGMCARRLSIPVIHSSAFHQAKPNDYSTDYINREPPISFHKFEGIDPYEVYANFLHEVDPFLESQKKEVWSAQHNIKKENGEHSEL